MAFDLSNIPKRHSNLNDFEFKWFCSCRLLNEACFLFLCWCEPKSIKPMRFNLLVPMLYYSRVMWQNVQGDPGKNRNMDSTFVFSYLCTWAHVICQFLKCVGVFWDSCHAPKPCPKNLSLGQMSFAISRFSWCFQTLFLSNTWDC